MFIFGGLINFLASVLGITPSGLRLILSIFAGYPLVCFYRSYVVDEQVKGMHHLFFVISGIVLCFLNYGRDVYHSLIAVSFTYLTLIIFGSAPEMLVGLNFIFHMTYIIIGYMMTMTDNYDICWTMPHCVLVLRLIGLAFDTADGLKRPNEITKEQNATALHELPTLLETFAFAYFPLTFLIGPQFNFKRYQQFIDGEYSLYVGAKRAGLQRFIFGLIYMAFYMIGNHFLPNSYLLSDNYRKEILPIKVILLGVWGKVVLCQYISCWLLVEGALIYLGFTYNGKLPNGEPDWSGCANINIFEFETGLTMQHYISSFNLSTNTWASRYIYKRLKFFEQRVMSHVMTLIFLAAWHGLHSGYYLAFGLEFLLITAERQMADFYSQVVLPKYGHILMDSCPVWEYCRFILLKSYDIIIMAFGLVPFIFLTFDRYSRVFGAVYYFGFILLGMWFGFFHYHKTRQQSAMVQQQN